MELCVGFYSLNDFCFIVKRVQSVNAGKVLTIAHKELALTAVSNEGLDLIGSVQLGFQYLIQLLLTAVYIE